jgi:hypothetical protein
MGAIVIFESIASALNLRVAPGGQIIGELKQGDTIEVDAKKADQSWVTGTVTSGVSTGRTGMVRRKWLVQKFDAVPTLSTLDRGEAGKVISSRTQEFDSVHYKLGDKAKTWSDLRSNGYVDCSGWVYLLAKEILSKYGLGTKPSLLYTFSDQQITNVGKQTGVIVSGTVLGDSLIQPGCIIGLDFAEYSWDRDRPLDIDHIVIVGQDAGGLYVSQSSSSGGGVNRVPLGKWLSSVRSLQTAGRMHLVDLLMLP